MKKWIMAGIALLTVAISSCDEDTSTLGYSLTSDVDRFTIKTDTFDVATKSIAAGAVLSRNAYTYLGRIKDPETGFYWLSGGEYPQFELSYTTYEYLDEYDERDTDVVITTESGNTLTLHVTQGERILRIDDEKPNYCFVPTEQGVIMVLNTGGGMGGPKLSDIKSVNTDFEADWTKEEAIYLFDGKGPEVVNNIKGYTIVPLPWADINESHLPDGEAKKMLSNGQWKLVLNYTGNRSLPNFNYFAMYNPYVGKLRFFYYLTGDANMKDINDHLWAVTVPSEWAAALERASVHPAISSRRAAGGPLT